MQLKNQLLAVQDLNQMTKKITYRPLKVITTQFQEINFY